MDREGRAVVDLAQRAPGRGLYLCPRQECFDRAARRTLPFAARQRFRGKTLAAFCKEAAVTAQLTQKGVT